jgi:small ligand-binding sensory domain FIST
MMSSTHAALNEDHMEKMHWVSALSRAENPAEAVAELGSLLARDLAGHADLLIVFASEHYRSDYMEIVATLRARLGAETLIGCSASGVIANGEEVEFERAIGVTAARLPGVQLASWHLQERELGPGTPHSAQCTVLAQQLGDQPAQLLVLADPFSIDPEQLLRSLDTAFPAAVIAGGLASGASRPGEIALFHGNDVHDRGALVLALQGNLQMHTAVAQGCRPIGEPMFLTSHEGTTIQRLDQRTPIEVLAELYNAADAEDRKLIQESLFVGVAMRDDAGQYQQGDFLVRNIIGGDQEHGSIDVAAALHPNHVVQFHLRDAQTSAEDLQRVLDRAHATLAERRPAGALLFSCTGRGAGLYGERGHDSRVFRQQFADTPLAGFFCNGEIGPVQGHPYLHGYTSSFVLFSADG